MKTSTMLLIGGAAAALYFLAKKNAGTATPGIMSATTTVPRMSDQPMVVVNVDANDDADYAVPGWGWSQPTWGTRAWRGGGGRRGGHGGHGGHGHGHGGHH